MRLGETTTDRRAGTGEDQRLVDEIERWFVRRGLPHAIDDYSARDDILTRTVPFLATVLVVEVAITAFGQRFSGWGQVGIVALAAVVVLCVMALINRIRRRPLLRLPDQIAWTELATFMLVPPLLAVTLDGSTGEAVVIAAANVCLLGLAFTFAYFGVLPMIVFAIRQIARRLAKLSGLLARVLPTLLLFVTFVFFNAEMWQVASDFTTLGYALVVTTIASIAFAFMAVRLPVELGGLAAFDSWDEVSAIASRSGAPDLPPVGDLAAAPTAVLDREDRRNIAVLLFVSFAIQVALIGAIVAVALFALGVVSIREHTIRQWTVQGDELGALVRFNVGGAEYLITRIHLRMAGFISVFAMLQFAVQLMLDRDYRAEFAADISGELREILAVQALYQQTIAVRT